MKVPESKVVVAKKCFILKVKRKNPEKPLDSLILETVTTADKRKRIKLSPPEEYLQNKMGEIGLTEGKKWSNAKLFQRVENLDEEAKKAVKIEGNADCSLFELPTKGCKVKERWNSNKIFDQKVKLTEQQIHIAKKQRSKLIEKKRGINIEDSKEANTIEETKELNRPPDILYCDEKLMTLE